MKIISFNVNGLRAILKKSVIQNVIQEQDPDILCLQETKCPATFDAKLPFKFSKIVGPTIKKGYSGVAVYSKTLPLQEAVFEEGVEEGRVIALEFSKAWLVNVYTPNSKPDLSRLEYRVKVWEPAFRKFVNHLSNHGKPVVIVGDLNVAPTEIDLHNPKVSDGSHGFTLEERSAFAALLSECKLVDAFRTMHTTKQEYTWFSPFAKSRERNKGWRIDHTLISKSLVAKIKQTAILSQYFGSDHVPVLIDISK